MNKIKSWPNYYFSDCSPNLEDREDEFYFSIRLRKNEYLSIGKYSTIIDDFDQEDVGQWEHLLYPYQAKKTFGFEGIKERTVGKETEIIFPKKYLNEGISIALIANNISKSRPYSSISILIKNG